MPPEGTDSRVDTTGPIPFAYQQGTDYGRLEQRVKSLENEVEELKDALASRPVKKPLLESLEEAIGFKTLLLVVLVCTALIFASCAAYKIGGERLVQLVIEARKGGG